MPNEFGMGRSRLASLPLLLLVWLVVVAAVAAAAGTARAPEAGAAEPKATRFTHKMPDGRSREFLFYAPPGGGRRPLLVFLHGCIETAANAEASTGFTRLAAAQGFAVAYPDQRVTPNSSAPVADGNGSGCWNWFLPENHGRDVGEPAIIVAIARRLIAAGAIDPDRVYVHGVSAGADMAVILAANYPDVFAAGAVLAGCPYSACTDLTGALAHRAMGPRARPFPLFVAQATTDNLSVVALGGALVNSWLGLNDLADDGAANGSVSRQPASVEHKVPSAAPRPGSGDPCVRARNWPCPGGALGLTEYPHTVARFKSAKGCALVESWFVHGAAHNHLGSKSGGPYADAVGPDLSKAAWEFLSRHDRRGGCRP